MVASAVLKALQDKAQFPEGEQILFAQEEEEAVVKEVIDPEDKPGITPLSQGTLDIFARMGRAPDKSSINELREKKRLGEIRVRESLAGASIEARDFDLKTLKAGDEVPPQLAKLNLGLTPDGLVTNNFLEVVAGIQASLRLSGETELIAGTDFSNTVKVILPTLDSGNIVQNLTAELSLNMEQDLSSLPETREILEGLGIDFDKQTIFQADVIEVVAEAVGDGLLSREAATLLVLTESAIAISNTSNVETQEAINEYFASTTARLAFAERSIWDLVGDFTKLVIFPFFTGSFAEAADADISGLLQATDRLSGAIRQMEDVDLLNFRAAMFEAVLEQNNGNVLITEEIIRTIFNPDDSIKDNILIDAADTTLLAAPVIKLGSTVLLSIKAIGNILKVLNKASLVRMSAKLGRQEIATTLHVQSGETKLAQRATTQGDLPQLMGSLGMDGKTAGKVVIDGGVPGVAEGNTVINFGKDMARLAYDAQRQAELIEGAGKRSRTAVIPPRQLELFEITAGRIAANVLPGARTKKIGQPAPAVNPPSTAFVLVSETEQIAQEFFNVTQLMTRSPDKVTVAINPMKLTEDILGAATIEAQVAGSKGITRLTEVKRLLKDLAPVDAPIGAERAGVMALFADNPRLLAFAEENKVFGKGNLIRIEVAGIEVGKPARTIVSKEIVGFDTGESFITVAINTSLGEEVVFKLPIDRETYSYDIGNLGNNINKPLSGIRKLFGSEVAQGTKVFAGTTAEVAANNAILEFVDGMIISERVRARFKNIFGQAIQVATQGFSRKEKLQVFRALDMGDDQNKVFTVSELMKNFALDEGQIGSYFSFRRIFDKIREMENTSHRRSLGFNKFKELKMTNSQVFRDAPKVFVEEVKGLPPGAKTVYDARIGDEVPITAELTEKIRNKEVLAGELERLLTVSKQAGARTASGNQPIIGGNSYKFVIYSPNNVTGLPAQVIHARIGHVPRLQDGVFFVIRQKRQVTINGETGFKTEDTLQLFSLSADANKAIIKLRADHVATGGKADDIFVTGSRELNRKQKQEMLLQSHGGSVTSSRSKREVLFQSYNGKNLRVDPQRAAEIAAARASHLAANTEVILQAQEAVLQRYAKFFENPRNISSKIDTATPEGKAAEAARDQVLLMRGIASRETTITSNVMRKVGTAMEESATGGKIVNRKLAAFAYNLTNADPSTLQRGLTFHAFLGYNVGQLLTQFAGIAIPSSLDPLRIPFHMTEVLSVRRGIALLEKGGVELLDLHLNTIKKLGLNLDDHRALTLRLFNNGFKDSVLDTADLRAINGGNETTKGMLLRFANRTSGYIFGEAEFAQRTFGMSFAAQEHARKVGKRLRDFNQADWKAVEQRALAVSIRQDRANASGLQRSAFGSIPSQFTSVIGKFYEAVGGFDKRFSSYDRFKIVLGHVGIFGVAGLPFYGDALSDQMANALVGTEEFNEMSPEQQQVVLASVEQGVLGMMSMLIFGRQFDFRKFSLLKAPEGFIENAIESNGLEMIAGPSGAFGLRIYKTAGEFTQIWNGLDASGELLSPKLFSAALIKVMEINSGGRNLLNSGFFGDVLYATKDGQFLMDEETRNDVIVKVAKLLAISVNEVQETFRRADAERAIDQQLDDATRSAFQWQKFTLQTTGRIPSEDEPEWAAFKAGLSEYAFALPEPLRAEYWRTVSQQIKGDSNLSQKWDDSGLRVLKNIPNLDNPVLKKIETDRSIENQRVDESEAARAEAARRDREENE